MTYRTNDGQVLQSTEPREIVNELHGLSMSPCANDSAFMRETAGRVMRQFDKRVRCNSAAAFCADLITAGLLIEDGNGDTDI